MRPGITDSLFNRPTVLKRSDGYHIWFTGQTKGERSSIGCATSPDGKTWKPMSDKPVLIPEKPWEKVALMCPHVLWDEQAKLYHMWYSGGEQQEPNAIGYATSPDGLTWTKYEQNPVFTGDQSLTWEQNRGTGCQVEHAHIGGAPSRTRRTLLVSPTSSGCETSRRSPPKSR